MTLQIRVTSDLHCIKILFVAYFEACVPGNDGHFGLQYITFKDAVLLWKTSFVEICKTTDYFRPSRLLFSFVNVSFF